MSFATDVKEEIFRLLKDDCCKVQMLKGMLIGKSKWEFDQDKKEWTLGFSGHQHVVVKTFHYLLTDLFVTKYVNSFQREKTTDFHVGVEDMVKLKDLLEIEHDLEIPLPYLPDLKECCKKSFLAGMYMTAGSVTDPRSKNYHFEIKSLNINSLKLIEEILSQYDIECKFATRRDKDILYIKKSNMISDILRIMGCSNALLEYEDHLIKRDYYITSQRLANIDVANQVKTFKSTKEYLELFKKVEFKQDELTPVEKRFIELKKDDDSLSLSEIAKIISSETGEDVSKSRLNHFIRKLKAM